MALEKYLAVNNALIMDDSPVRVIGRTGGLSVEARGFPKFAGGLNLRLQMDIYTVPAADVKPEAAKLNEVLGALIDQVRAPITPEDITAFAGGITKVGPQTTYADLQLGGLRLYEEINAGVQLKPSLDIASEEVNALLSSFRPPRLRFQSGILVHIIPSLELAKIKYLLDQGHRSVAALEGRRDWTKLSGYDVQQLSEGKTLYPHLKLPELSE